LISVLIKVAILNFLNGDKIETLAIFKMAVAFHRFLHLKGLKETA